MGDFRSNLPLGTTDPTVFVEGNVPNYDEAVNAQYPEWLDRFGVSRLTWFGMEENVRLAILKLNYSEVEYQAGNVIDTLLQYVIAPDGNAYVISPSVELPYTLTGDWATDSPNFWLGQDSMLRSELSSNNGTALIGFDGGSLHDQISKDGSSDSVLTGNFPRILKYNSGFVDTRALGVTAGVTSDEIVTQRIKDALADGMDLYIEPSESRYKIGETLLSSREGQIITGHGIYSVLEMLSDATTIIQASHDDFSLRFLHLIPSSVKTSTFTGFGAYASGCDRPTFENIFVSGGRSGGLGFSNVNGGRIAHTRHFLSSVLPTDDHTLMGCDVALYRSCNDCLIEDVRSESGIGMTVNIQTAVLTEEKSNGNTISNVYSKNQSAYAISLYVSDKTKQEMLGTTIINPMIDGVTGSITNTITNNRSYGAGIYVQGAEHTTIIGGHIRKTNQLTDSETLAPGGIGVTNSRSFSAIGTKISDCAWYGVFASDPANQGVAEGVGLLRDVEISKSGKSGIRQVTFRKLVIDGGKSVQNESHGLNVLKTTEVGVETEVRNWFASVNKGSGIETGNTTLLDVRNTFINANTSAGISTSAVTFNVDTVTSQNNGTFGVRAAGGNLAGNIKNLTSRGNATGLEVPSSSNIGVEVSTLRVRSNTSANYAGALNQTGGWRTLANSATPQLNGLQDFYATGGTTAITGFSGGEPGQRITIFVAHGVTVLGKASTHGDVLIAVNIGGGTGWKLVK